MKESQLVTLLESVLGPSRSARGGVEAVFKCPNCNHHKHKLTINKQTQQFQCWVCNFQGRGANKILQKANADGVYFKQLNEINKYYNFKSPKQPQADKISQASLPEGFKPLYKKSNSLLRKKALQYLNSRGITVYDIIKYNIGYAEEGICDNMVIIPSYNEYGLLNFWVGRSFQENTTYKHKLAPYSRNIIGFDLHINWDLPIILCEGAFDAMTIRHNVIPLFGKRISKELLTKIIQSNCEEIYLVLDLDAITDSLKHAEKLLSLGKRVYLVELGEEDPNQLGYDKMFEILNNTKELSYSGLIQKKILYQ